MKLEELTEGAAARGIVHEGIVTVVSAAMVGQDALQLVYKDAEGNLGDRILYRDDEARIQCVEAGRPWSFSADGARFRLASEAMRIQLAHLFDPVLAVHTSIVDPLPHQITAVYEEML